MGATRQKDLVLILARQLAERLPSPVFLVDHEGTLVFYNGAAERVLGVTFAEAGELSAGEWGERWDPQDPDTGTVLTLEELPLVIAVMQRRPAHRPMVIIGSDGARRSIEVTAYPLQSREDRFVGAVAIFWEVAA